jgi:hypothetical protein
MPKTPPYSKEFKREAVQLLRRSDRSVAQLAKGLGVSEGCCHGDDALAGYAGCGEHALGRPDV